MRGLIVKWKDRIILLERIGKLFRTLLYPEMILLNL